MRTNGDYGLIVVESKDALSKQSLYAKYSVKFVNKDMFLFTNSGYGQNLYGYYMPILKSVKDSEALQRLYNNTVCQGNLVPIHINDLKKTNLAGHEDTFRDWLDDKIPLYTKKNGKIFPKVFRTI